jgi:hypothetical protein
MCVVCCVARLKNATRGSAMAGGFSAMRRGTSRGLAKLIGGIDPSIYASLFVVFLVWIMVSDDAARRSSGVLAISQAARFVPFRQSSVPLLGSICPDPAAIFAPGPDEFEASPASIQPPPLV